MRFVSLTFLCLLFLAVPVSAKDDWISVKSKNFFLVGNASEKEIRGVATKLEQFRETFRRLFPRNKFDSHISTNVVVFKNSSAYNPFRPKLANGKPDTGIAGYFQPGEDVNYITLSTGGERADTYGTIFHEYVHFLLNTHFGKSDVPPWFNEGLAEYYQTFLIEDDMKVTLGGIQDNHLLLLQESKLIPLKTMFEVDNYSLHRNGNHSRSIFYAQAWALIHYLIQGNKGANADNLSKFLQLVMNKTEPEKAFQQVFGYDFATMEEALKKYVAQRTFRAMMYTAKEKMLFDTEMTVTPLSEAETNAYLGDLLYHTHEYADAEIYLQKALAADAKSSMANTALGLVRLQQRKFDDAKKHLENAVATGQRNHLTHYYYAYVLSRESMDESYYVSNFPADKAKKMREALHKAIEISPHYSESYHLLGFINMVNNEQLDEAIAYLKKGLTYSPGNPEYLMMIAQIYMRQEKYKEAKELAQALVKTASEPSTHANAQNLLNSIKQYEDTIASNAAAEKQMASGGPPPALQQRQLSAEEIKYKEARQINDLNRQLTKPGDGEKQIIGHIKKIGCEKGNVFYSVKTTAEEFTLMSEGFTSLDLIALTPESQALKFGCAANLPNATVLTYRPGTDPKVRGTLLSVAFVPDNFKIKTDAEMEAEEKRYYESINDSVVAQAEANKKQFFQQNMRKPASGEKQLIGVLEKIECSGNKVIFVAKVDNQTLKLSTLAPNAVMIRAFTPEAGQMRFGCGTIPPAVNAVITFVPNGDGKGKEAGQIMAIEFVPKDFKMP